MAAIDWNTYPKIKVSQVVVAGLNGKFTFQRGAFVVPKCTGWMEIKGEKTDGRATIFLVGFSAENTVPAPSFSLNARAATGTLIVPSQCFGAFVEIARSPNAHFGMGGDGTFNSIANDPAGLLTISAKTGLPKELRAQQE